jgi:ABC-2 type transport system permease protein
MAPGQPPQQDPPKGDIKPLLTALGVEMDLTTVSWSDVNPSHQLRNRLPKNFVWAQRAKGAIHDEPAVIGINTVLFPYPGAMKKGKGSGGSITLRALVTVAPSAAHGTHTFDDVMKRSRSLFGPGPLRPVRPERHEASEGEAAVLAYQITGKMPRVYDLKAGKEGESTKAGKKGDPSERDINVILVADTDFFFDEFFMIYRNADNRFSDDDASFLRDLRNVQFAANLVDALAGDESFMQLRTRRPQARPLATLEEVTEQTQKKLLEVETQAKTDADDRIKDLRDNLTARIKAVDDREGLDKRAKSHLQASMKQSAERQLAKVIEGINRESEAKVREAKVDQRRAIEEVRDDVRMRALGIPGGILFFLALGVWFNRRRGEKLTIPQSRQRRS